jgi:hypothetical protein
MRLVDTEHGKCWEVCGMGYCRYHQQKWQAEVFYQYLLQSLGTEAKES